MKYTYLLLLLSLSCPVIAADEEDETITYKLGGKEYTTTRSENPELAKFMDKIESIAEQTKQAEEGESEEPQPEPVKKTPPKPELGATPQTAQALYDQGDYENAYEHYKELAAQGDADASLMLGVMHGGGQGVESDEAAAHAWMVRSAEQGNDQAAKLLGNYRLSDEEKARSKEYFNEMSKELDEEDAAANADDRYREIKQSSYQQKYAPATVSRSDQGSLKVKKYSRDKHMAKPHTDKAQSYDSPAAESYGHERFVLEKEY